TDLHRRRAARPSGSRPADRQRLRTEDDGSVTDAWRFRRDASSCSPKAEQPARNRGKQMSSRYQLFRSASLAVVLCLGAGAALAQERTYTFDIPAESLSNALRDYGRTTHQQLLFTETLTAGKTAPAVQGRFGANDALQRLLANSGLAAVRTATGALVIQRAESQSPPVPAKAAAASSESAALAAVV